MHKFEVEGGARLNGTVEAGGSKNAALPILFASILNSKPLAVRRVPRLRDISTTLELLRGVGARAEQEGNLVRIEIPKLASVEAPYDLVRTMRASVLMLGPFLARERKAKVSLPGGCAIGTRPVDIHLAGLECLGAKFQIDGGYIYGECPAGLRGAEVPFRFPSVGATENLMMAATLASGVTTIRNAAREPEIVDLARAINAMGGKVSGAGTSDIRIEGVASLRAAELEVMGDRIEAGTLLLAGPITGGSTKVTGIDPGVLPIFLEKLEEAGVSVERGTDYVSASFAGGGRGVSFTTAPYPGFATDLQAQLMAFLTQVRGESVIEENIFENRFMHVPELSRLGAKVRVEGARAVVEGTPGALTGATVMATDLRASASLVLAGLCARGATSVRRIYHLDRGYEGLEAKLTRLGARVCRLDE